MREVVDGVSNAVLAISVTVVGWGTFVTRKVFHHDVSLAEMNTKLDLLLNHFGVETHKKDEH